MRFKSHVLSVAIAQALLMSQPNYADEAIVRFRDDSVGLFSQFLQTAENMGTFVIAKISNHGDIILLGKQDDVAMDELLQSLRSNPDVLYAEPNIEIQIPDPAPDAVYSADEAAQMLPVAGVPDDPLLTWGYQDIDADLAPPAPADAPLVAVIDTGVDYTHSELAGRVVLGRDFHNNDNDPMDDHGHGTHVAGIIAATPDNGLGSAGISPTSHILALKVLRSSGRGSEWNVIQGVYEAADHPDVKIINISLGTSIEPPPFLDAIKYAAQEKGKLVVVAAGNGNTPTPYFPAGWSHDVDGVIGVAANDQYGCKTEFSNYGENATIAAPGLSILSTLPDNSYAEWSGTAIAAPFVAGAAARLLSDNPGLANVQLKSVLESNTDPLVFDDSCWQSNPYHFDHLNLAEALLNAPDTPPLAISDSTFTVNLQVDTENNDGYEQLRYGRTYLNESQFVAGQGRLVGYRFEAIPIPKDAVIVFATLTQRILNVPQEDVSLLYWGEASADAEAFSGARYDFSRRRAATLAIVEQALPAGTLAASELVASPDLAGIVQEIINRPDWQAGNAVSLFMQDQGSLEPLLLNQFEGDPAASAQLEVQYRLPGNALPPGPSLPADTIPPEVTIQSPVDGHETSESSITVTGIAADDMGVDRITWTNSQGSEGSASGVTSWTINELVLSEGENMITVTAYDVAGNAAAATVTIVRVANDPDDGTDPAPAESLELRVSSGNNDGYEQLRYGRTYLNESQFVAGQGRLVGYRFEAIPIPKDAVIVFATLTQRILNVPQEDVSLLYWGEASADAEAFSGARYDFSRRRAATLAIVEQALPAGTLAASELVASPDLAGIVQEIINRPDWQAGNAVSLFMQDQGSLEPLLLNQFEGDPAASAQLEVQYRLPGNALPPGPSLPADTIPPEVTIQSPVDGHETSESSITVTGIAADDMGVDRITWTNSQGSEGSASGVTSWTINELVLSEGENMITVTAYDVAGNAAAATVTIVRVANDPDDGTDPVPAEFEGFGAHTTGGSGHEVLTAHNASELTAIVNTVKARGGNATIVLSGAWTYRQNIAFNHAKNITIDGSSASVLFENMRLLVRCSDNVIIQGLRIRNNYTGDDVLQINSSTNVVIDHNSFSGAGDGNLDITGWSCGASKHITVSWNILADTWKQSLVKYNGTTDITFHHNLFYNGGTRLPSVEAGVFDIRNNVIWQWGSSATSLGGGAQANIINNYYELGNKANKGHAAIWYRSADDKAWIEGNVLPPQEKDVSRLTAPLAVPAVRTQSAQEAKALVLEHAGAPIRDAYDAQIVDRVRSGRFPELPPYNE